MTAAESQAKAEAAALEAHLAADPEYQPAVEAERKARKVYDLVRARYDAAEPKIHFTEVVRALREAARGLDAATRDLPKLPNAIARAAIMERAPETTKAALGAVVAAHALSELRGWLEAEADRVNVPVRNPHADELADADAALRRAEGVRAAIAHRYHALAEHNDRILRPTMDSIIGNR